MAQSLQFIPAVSAQKTWFGHPRGLTILFLTETWEKFSFYGMRALLVYYLVKSVGFAPAQASVLYGLYTGFIYLTPIIGGYIADRWLGRRRSVILGGSIMTLGHIMMTSPALLYPALATIIVGNGFYLPNLASQIKGLYQPGDPRQTSAFNVYYVGVNLGGFLAPLVCGTLGELYGWHWGFGAAGFGMALGLTIYLLGGHLLPPEPLSLPAQTGAPPQQARPRGTFVVLLALVMIAVVLFRGAYEQIGNTIALWVDGAVDRHIGTFVIPGSWFQSLNPLLVFLLTPILIRRWDLRAEMGRARTQLQSMAIGGFGLSACYAGLAGLSFISAGSLLHWSWFVVFITAYTLSELYIFPTGMALFASIAPPGHQATTISVWFLGLFAGNLFAGSLGSLWPSMPHAWFFLLMGSFAGCAGLMLAGLNGWKVRADAARQPRSAMATEI